MKANWHGVDLLDVMLLYQQCFCLVKGEVLGQTALWEADVSVVMWMATLCFHSVDLWVSYNTAYVSTAYSITLNRSSWQPVNFEWMRWDSWCRLSASQLQLGRKLYFRDPIVADGSINSGYLFCVCWTRFKFWNSNKLQTMGWTLAKWAETSTDY